MPGQGAAITSGPLFSRPKFRQPSQVEHADVDRLTKHVLRRIKDLTDREFAGLPENERAAAVNLVADVFDGSDRNVWDCDLDPQSFALHLLRTSKARLSDYGLSAQATSFYELLVHTVSLQVIQFITTWPNFTARAELEELKRLRKITSTVEKINEKLGPGILSVDLEFEQRYTQLVSDTLDQLELFGVDLQDRSNRTYNLTTAYITLSVSSTGTSNAVVAETHQQMGVDSESEDTDDYVESVSAPSSAGMRAELAISRYKRLLLRGDAGSGKTTLLHWLSVNCSRRSLPHELAEWNTLVPFLLPLRRFAESSLPTPINFFPEVGTHLADELPDKWVSRMLAAGRALVLIDGVDELPDDQRESARSWLRQLVRSYPNSHYIVTSRPAAAEADWLNQDGFAVLDMLPMTQGDVSNFISHWHDAAKMNVAEPSEIPALELGQVELVTSIRESRQLRRLASNPLLCALLCTLNRDRNSQLPKDRMELYRAALEMLLLRRDRERRINYPEPPHLGDAQKKSILGSFAYWLLRNGLTDASEQQAIKQVELSLQSMVTVEATGERVYDYLLVRSGCLRRPVDNRVDFVHRTFQEYLAAARIVEVDDLEGLLDHAHLDQWHEVVVMAVGHARPRERSEILSGLLKRGNEEPQFKNRLHLLAAACLETVGECDPVIFQRVRESTAELIPPRRMTEAKEVASAGEMVIPLIPHRRFSANVAAATVRMASLVGGDSALSLISRFAKDDRVTVQREIERAWTYFDSVEYVQAVIQKNPEFWREMRIHLPHYLPALKLMPQLERVRVFCEISDWDWIPESEILTHLQVHRNVGPVDLAPIRRCPNLMNLTLRGWAYTDLRDLESLQSLVSLSLRGFNGEDLGLPYLKSLKSLSVIGLNGQLDVEALAAAVPSLRSATLAVTLKNCSALRKLQHLEVVSVTRADSEILESLAEVSTLRRVILNATASCADDVAKLAKIPTLEYLSLNLFDEGDGDGPIQIDVEGFLQRPKFELSVSTDAEISIVGDAAGEMEMTETPSHMPYRWKRASR